ncbi:MAG: hypothetical protein SPE59_02410 [Treponema sp.]|nr:hypothetical protein [Spirochaetia bacterium]MDY5122631.1 hypothetical protein [Treponema sp.]
MRTLKKIGLVLAAVLGLSMLAGCSLFGSVKLSGTKWTNSQGLIYEFGTDSKLTITVPATSTTVGGFTVSTPSSSTEYTYSVNGDELTITEKSSNGSSSQIYQVVAGKKNDEGLKVIYLQQDGSTIITLTQYKESK